MKNTCKSNLQQQKIIYWVVLMIVVSVIVIFVLSIYGSCHSYFCVSHDVGDERQVVCTGSLYTFYTKIHGWINSSRQIDGIFNFFHSCSGGWERMLRYVDIIYYDFFFLKSETNFFIFFLTKMNTILTLSWRYRAEVEKSRVLCKNIYYPDPQHTILYTIMC